MGNRHRRQPHLDQAAGRFSRKAEAGLLRGIFIAFPLIATQISRFIAPGLYAHEKERLPPLLIATAHLLPAGGWMVYFFLLPTAIQLLLFTGARNRHSEDQNAIQLMPDIEAYLDFVMMLILAFGFCFQCPSSSRYWVTSAWSATNSSGRAASSPSSGVFIVAANRDARSDLADRHGGAPDGPLRSLGPGRPFPRKPPQEGRCGTRGEV